LFYRELKPPALKSLLLFIANLFSSAECIEINVPPNDLHIISAVEWIRG
jgi:hypothetical protein